MLTHCRTRNYGADSEEVELQVDYQKLQGERRLHKFFGSTALDQRLRQPNWRDASCPQIRRLYLDEVGQQDGDNQQYLLHSGHSTTQSLLGHHFYRAQRLSQPDHQSLSRDGADQWYSLPAGYDQLEY